MGDVLHALNHGGRQHQNGDDEDGQRDQNEHRGRQSAPPSKLGLQPTEDGKQGDRENGAPQNEHDKRFDDGETPPGEPGQQSDSDRRFDGSSDKFSISIGCLTLSHVGPPVLPAVGCFARFELLQTSCHRREVGADFGGRSVGGTIRSAKDHRDEPPTRPRVHCPDL